MPARSEVRVQRSGGVVRWAFYLAPGSDFGPIERSEEAARRDDAHAFDADVVEVLVARDEELGPRVEGERDEVVIVLVPRDDARRIHGIGEQETSFAQSAGEPVDITQDDPVLR